MATIIEAADLAHKAIEFFNCPEKMYTLSEVAGELTDRSSSTITKADVRAFRIIYLEGNMTLTVPLITDVVPVSTPQTLEEMCNVAMIDTLGLRNGVATHGFEVFKRAQKDGDGKLSLGALSLILQSTDSIDKKLKQISPKSDPARSVLGMKEYNKFKNIFVAIDQKHPEIKLWELYEIELKLQRSIYNPART